MKVMDAYTAFVVNHRKGIVVVTALLCLVCAVSALMVSVNYDMSSYLPKSCDSAQSLRVMEDEFTEAVPNARVMVEDVSLAQALDCKKQMQNVPGVESVMWLDDVADVRIPLETQDKALVESYYENGNALFSVCPRGSTCAPVKAGREMAERHKAEHFLRFLQEKCRKNAGKPLYGGECDVYNKCENQGRCCS